MELTQQDKRISYAQAYNLAVALLAPNLKGKADAIEIKKDIEGWQKWFYARLTTGYMEKFAPHLVPSGPDEKKRKDVVQDEVEHDIE